MPVFFTRCIVTPVLALMEGRGVHLDPERVAAEHAAQTARLAELETELAVVTGGINLASRKQLGEVLYDKLGFEEPTRRGEVQRTAAGGRKTDKATLGNLKANTPEQKRFVELLGEYAKVSARLSKSLNFFKGVCEEYGGTFRARFNQAVTQTHRLSSSGRRLKFKGGSGGVQFQNMPREYKRLICARDPDYVVVEVDGAQLEFRVAGEVSHDPQVHHDVETNADIHRYTASVLNALFGVLKQEFVIDTLFTEFILDHGDFLAMWLIQDSLQKGRFPRP
jgi:DNA polymerase-1